MQLMKIAVFLTAALAHVQAAAIPAGPDETGRVLVHSRVMDGGTLGYWASDPAAVKDVDWDAGWNETTPSSSPAAAPVLGPRCGSNQVFCSTDNQAFAYVCTALLVVLINNRSARVAPAVGALSWTVDNNACWVAWRGRIDGLEQGYLMLAAANVRDTCTVGGSLTAGHVEDVRLNLQCTNVCLSNRPWC
ncbi:hypothetical protein BT67DRAFT_445087 [Trichocladium antarcticum]|uniref:Uncharacterized protein n=1 Tax=Trichocladium antarcticum TaxID=1450529 RepID=A0AAN6UDU9_9PEZI|nr:hypothetical protein BT67DRAFT_445087 [Trichocladium antarcticum]